jgi:hypothetical protein
MGKMTNAYEISVGKPEMNGPFVYEGNIKTNLKTIGREGVDWIHAAQDRNQWRILVSVLSGCINGGRFLDQLIYYQFLETESAPWK